jgi:spore cortex biosynthesis protein YabQ
MILSIEVQIFYFLSTIAAGFFVGIMFDTYRILRGFNYPNKFITAVSDLLFWIFAALVTFIFFLYTNNGDLRYYTFVGLFLGLFIYFKTISKPFANILKWIIYIIIKAFRMLMVLLLYPIRLLRYLVNYLFYTLRLFGQESAKKLKSGRVVVKAHVKEDFNKIKKRDKKIKKKKEK